MATDVIMPALGVAQQTGTLLKWLKTDGQTVTKGEPLMEIETDKATVEIEAAASGILTRISAKPGDEVPVGQTIALILAPGEALPATQQAFVSSLPKHPPSEGEGRGEGHTSTSTTTTIAAHSTTRSGGRILASPKAKRLAKEQGIELSSLRGSGPEGSILARDVIHSEPENARQPKTATSPREIIPLSPMRRIVGERMAQSKQRAPHFYISMEVDMTTVRGLQIEWRQRGEEVIPSINDFILHACAAALKNFPALNASFTEQGIEQHPDINLGVAVALEEGLVVPVIRNADRLSLNELAQQSRQLADKAQNKKLLPLDYEGGTFTVSNLGMLGVDSFVAIINPPQCAILAVGRVAPRVVADDGMFAVRSLMTATLSADHRVIDGALAARFLGEVKRRLEKPTV
jgi:pyruvate dehydrogenase E2 component (dihydrolipoyllysine-residue acetyltransferase)